MYLPGHVTSRLSVRRKPEDNAEVVGFMKGGDHVEVLLLDVCGEPIFDPHFTGVVNKYARIWSDTMGEGYVVVSYLREYIPNASPNAQGNTERALAACGGPASTSEGTLIVGQQRRVDGHVWQLCERLMYSGCINFFRCRLVSKSAKSPYVLGENQTLSGTFLLRGEDVSHQSFEEDQRASSRRELELRDECGRLATQLRETRQTMAIASDALSDVMAWLGPTKVRDFEKWRAKTRK